ncbi:MAG: hypothetical protein MJ233_03340 [Mycoplasmoidaceae bacterium]|nr:hypothetical protein [Mycoplasmoidaceae bacterium]
MLLDTNYVPNAMVESTGRVEAHLLILNGQYELTEVTNTKVDALPSKYGDITVEAGYIDESEGFYYDIVVPFNFSTYVTDYDEGFTTSVHVECSKEDNGTCTINASAKSLTTPVLDFNAPENIILSTNDGVVYEGELEAGTYEWVNPETEGQTAGDLT